MWQDGNLLRLQAQMYVMENYYEVDEQIASSHCGRIELREIWFELNTCLDMTVELTNITEKCPSDPASSKFIKYFVFINTVKCLFVIYIATVQFLYPFECDVKLFQWHAVQIWLLLNPDCASYMTSYADDHSNSLLYKMDVKILARLLTRVIPL